MKDKKGVYFSSDALIALVIILMTVIIAYPVIKYSYKESEIESDVLKVLSSLRIGEIDNSYVKSLIGNGRIVNLNNSVLEQIGEFYVENLTLARNLADSVLFDLDTKDNIGIWFGNTLITSKNSSSYDLANHVEVDRQLISGISAGESVTGYSARAYLSSEMQSKYHYFGGYYGEGNISINVHYSGNLSDIYMEIATNKDFDIYINEIFSGHYTNSSSEFTPASYDLSAYRTNFHDGDNIVKLSSDNLYIAGGYLRIIYDNSTIIDENGKYKFPGIEGIINIYDGFYIPGTLNEMDIKLHLLSNFSIFLNIGNVTVFNDTPTFEQIYEINNSYLSSKLNYSDMSYKTTPIRLGLDEIISATGQGNAVDIVFIIDSTGSMSAEIVDVRDIIQDFTGFLENNSIDFRLGLIEYKDYPISPCGWSSDFPFKIHTFNGNQFTTDANAYRNKVNSLVASGGYDLPESHLRAINESLTLDWREDVKKFDILLTDAPPHAKDCLKWNYWFCPGAPPGWCWWCGECNLSSNNDFSCNLGPKYVKNVTDRLILEDITFFYINKINGLCGNRIVADNMTNLTNGKYYEYTESEGVQNIILEIAGSIINITYSEQTANVSGEINSRLYPDSYINFNYTKPPLIYGLTNTFEKQFFNSTNAEFSIPENSTIIEANVISYSGPRWTDNVIINNFSIYNLSKYNLDYIKLGDPFAINIPLSYVETNNSVKLTTGISLMNSTEGSISNKIIYKLIRNISSFTPIFPRADGCIWSIEFEDTTTSLITVPSFYFGTDICFYESGNMAIFDNNDAVEQAVFGLLKMIDLDNDGKIDIKLTENNLVISSSQIDGIPYSWSTQVQVRRWI